jgi:LexA-binding, inner membrane-associated putative hydrolase
MPFTPFHLGPGLALKGVAAPVFSWSAFAAAQVLIDCETLYYLAQQEYPVHRFFHSFLGATAAGLVAALLCLGIVRASAVGLLRRVGSLVGSTSIARGECSVLGILAGGLVGGLSHPFLDGIMHPDVRPFMPWSDYNPFLGLIGMMQLHLACFAAALFGTVCVTFWRTRRAQRAG